jgi:hypothetical protein
MLPPMGFAERLNLSRTHGLIALLFLPAVLGLGTVVLWASAAQRCLALALLLLCLDQTRMAIVDLQAITAVATPCSGPDLRLDRFRLVTLSTIAVELVGFYTAGFWNAGLAWGGAIVLLSQLWFHALAGVQLLPGEPEPVREFGVEMRSPVLIADALGLVLLGLRSVFPLSVSALLLTLVMIYGWVKYGVTGGVKNGAKNGAKDPP